MAPLFLDEMVLRVDKGTVVVPHRFNQLDADKLEGMFVIPTEEESCGGTYRFLTVCSPGHIYFRRSDTKTPVSFISGRLLIKPDHMRFAGINSEVLYVGMGDLFELWNPEEFRRFEKPLDYDRFLGNSGI